MMAKLDIALTIMDWVAPLIDGPTPVIPVPADPWQMAHLIS
jgi:hypothetical protein